MYGGYGLSVFGSGTAGNTQPGADVQNFNIGRLIPILQSVKYGPPQATAGLTSQYKLLLQNVGNAAATFGSFMETVMARSCRRRSSRLRRPSIPGRRTH